ncbi:glycosyltransferase family 2 protein [Acidithiobacillus acidisediminis]|uniref:glycosyltransferase family 2 protein n=1 Tax=Acidithiobacillus acidisediminis TaxID=2937799 RepID=UPI00200D65A1
MADTVVAVVVTFNRKVLLCECLDALLGQTRTVDKIIVIDNASTDGTPEFLTERGYLPNNKIDYVRLSENTGGAGGFYEGVKRGYEAGYDWLWLMDDDAEPNTDALTKVSNHFGQFDGVVAFANLKVGEDGRPQYGHRGWFNFCRSSAIIRPISDRDLVGPIFIDHASFVGILVSSIAIAEIGYPKRELFIHYDDVEYCTRLRQIGNICMVPESIIVHKDGRGTRYQSASLFGRKSNRHSISGLWISYYGVRNYTWLQRNSKCGVATLLSCVGLFHFKRVVGILIYDDHKLIRIRFYINAVIDGWVGEFDNDKPARLLQTFKSKLLERL